MLTLESVFTFISVLASSHRAYSSCEPEISYPAPQNNLNTQKSTFQEVNSRINKPVKAGDYNGSSS